MPFSGLHWLWGSQKYPEPKTGLDICSTIFLICEVLPPIKLISSITLSFWSAWTRLLLLESKWQQGLRLVSFFSLDWFKYTDSCRWLRALFSTCLEVNLCLVYFWYPWQSMTVDAKVGVYRTLNESLESSWPKMLWWMKVGVILWRREWLLRSYGSLC